MDTAAFEELLLSATTSPAKKTLDQLLALLATSGNPIPENVLEQLNLLWEAWGTEELDDAQGAFCIGLAALPMTDSPVFRKLLAQGVKAVLPPYLCRPPVMKALGVRDEAVPLADFSARMERLRALKNGVILFLPGSGRWGIAGTPDSVGSLAVNTWGGTVGGSASVPMDIILKEAVLLSPGPELAKLVDPGRAMISSADFRALVRRKALNAVSEATIKIMAHNGCGRAMDNAEFEKYWSSSAKSAAPAGSRRACNGRSLKEIELLLIEEEKENAPFSDEEAECLHTFFTNLKADTAAREAKLLASIVARISPRATSEQMKEMFSPLLAKAPFWPGDPLAATLEKMSVWGELPAKTLELLAPATATIFPEEYLARCAMRFPLKSLNAVCANVPEELLYDSFMEDKGCTADFLLWVWKNRKRSSNEELMSLLTVDSVLRALMQENLPKAWGSAMRELKSLLLDNADFQKQLIHAAEDEVGLFAAALHGALFLSPGERQSLMVKLSRVSPLFREHLEGGAGQRILKAGIGLVDTDAPTGVEPHYTSVNSHKRLIKELADIINVHVPENREALKTARAHGDFRENSEFDAAKERRNFLSRRRTELERELALIQPLSLSSIKVENEAVIGCEVELAYGEGGSETFLLLGAWDGDPDRKCLSYRTRLGEALLHRKTGDKIEVPGKGEATLKAVRPLPEAMIAKLDA